MVSHCLSVVCVSDVRRWYDLEMKKGQGYLVNDTIPCEACIVDDDMDLALAKLGSLFN